MKKFLGVLILAALIPASAHAISSTISASMAVWKVLTVTTTTHMRFPTILVGSALNPVLTSTTPEVPVVAGGMAGYPAIITVTGTINGTVKLEALSTFTMDTSPATAVSTVTLTPTPAVGAATSLGGGGSTTFSFAGSAARPTGGWVDSTGGQYSGTSSPIVFNYN
jgi:hypothetical protein